MHPSVALVAHGGESGAKGGLTARTAAIAAYINALGGRALVLEDIDCWPDTRPPDVVHVFNS